MIKRASMMFGALLFVVAVGLGCEEEGPLPKVNCDTVSSVPSYGSLTILKVCNQCHATTLSGGARHDAPSNINYDVYAMAKAKAEDAAREVNGGDMPPSDADQDLAGAGGLDHAITPDEKTALYQWALCGTPN